MVKNKKNKRKKIDSALLFKRSEIPFLFPHHFLVAVEHVGPETAHARAKRARWAKAAAAPGEARLAGASGLPRRRSRRFDAGDQGLRRELQVAGRGPWLGCRHRGNELRCDATLAACWRVS